MEIFLRRDDSLTPRSAIHISAHPALLQVTHLCGERFDFKPILTEGERFGRIVQYTSSIKGLVLFENPSCICGLGSTRRVFSVGVVLRGYQTHLDGFYLCSF
jgi:hypothetical protein